MKELMVILLLLTWTGMVVAQQNDDNAFRTPSGTTDQGAFGGGNGRIPLVPIGSGDETMRTGTEPMSARQRAQSAFSTEGRSSVYPSVYPGTASMLDSQSTLRDSFPPRTSEPTRRFANADSTSGGGIAGSSRGSSTRQPIYLGLPTKAQNDLRQFGSVKAPIPDNNVDRITISDKNEPKQGSREELNATLRGDTLVFQMTPSQLAKIEDYSFVFEVPENYKGQYQTATIEYPQTLRLLETTQTPRSTTRDNSSFQSDDKRWRLAGDSDPQVPAGPTNRWDETKTTDADLRYQLELQRRQQNSEKQELAKKSRWLDEEVARMRARQQLDSQRQQTVTPGDRFANEAYRAGQTVTPIIPLANYPTYTNDMSTAANANTIGFMQIQDQMKRMENRVAQLGNENQLLKNEIQNAKDEDRKPLIDRFDIGSNNYRSGLASNASVLGNRRTEADPPNIGRPRLSAGNEGLIDNQDSKAPFTKNGSLTRPSGSRSNEMLLVYLMLLCSVGLNLYLWFLTRTFYSRYQELADELRETFTATV